MPARTTRFAPTLVRAMVLPAVLFVLAAGFLVAVTTQPGEARTGATTRADRDPVWRASYSRRFPGCVALVLWPAVEVPRALLVRDRTGTVTAISVRQAVIRLRSADRGDDVRTVGACR